MSDAPSERWSCLAQAMVLLLGFTIGAGATALIAWLVLRWWG